MMKLINFELKLRMFSLLKPFLLLCAVLIALACQEETSNLDKVNEVVFTYDSSLGGRSSFYYFNGIEYKEIELQKDALGNDVLNLDTINSRYGQLRFGVGLHAEIFITSGDSLKIELISNGDKKKLSFSGKNEDHYNYYYKQLELALHAYPEKIDNVVQNKASYKAYYNKNIALLNEYESLNEVSKDFKTHIENELMYRYLFQMISPVSNKTVSIENLPNHYFDNVDIQFFKDESLLVSRYGTMTFGLYIQYYFTNGNGDFSKELFDTQMDFISKNFTGSTREYAITRILEVYNLALFPNNIEFLKFEISEKRKLITENIYLDKINDIETKLKLSNAKLPDSIASIGLISISDEVLTLGDLLHKNKGNVLVFDIWASWCAICIYNMQESKNLKKEMMDLEKFEWVYLSIDREKSTDKWRAKSNELKDLGLLKNQYIINEDEIPKFNSFFGIDDNGIPIYVMFNKKGDLVLPNAPRPTDFIYFKRAIDELQ